MCTRDVPDRVQERQRQQQEQSQRDRDHDDEEQDRDERQQEERRDPEPDRGPRSLPEGPDDRAVEGRGDEQEEEPQNKRGDRVADPPRDPTREADVAGVEPGRHALLLSGDRGALLDRRCVRRDEVAPDLGARTNGDRAVEDDDITRDVSGDIGPAVEHDDGPGDGPRDRCRPMEDQRGVHGVALRHDELATQHDLVARRVVVRGSLRGRGHRKDDHEHGSTEARSHELPDMDVHRSPLRDARPAYAVQAARAKRGSEQAGRTWIVSAARPQTGTAQGMT